MGTAEETLIELKSAIAHGNVEDVRALLEGHPRLTSVVGPTGQTILEECIECETELLRDIANLLVEYTPEVLLRGDIEEGIFFRALWKPSVDLAIEIVSALTGDIETVCWAILEALDSSTDDKEKDDFILIMAELLKNPNCDSTACLGHLYIHFSDDCWTCSRLLLLLPHMDTIQVGEDTDDICSSLFDTIVCASQERSEDESTCQEAFLAFLDILPFWQEESRTDCRSLISIMLTSCLAAADAFFMAAFLDRVEAAGFPSVVYCSVFISLHSWDLRIITVQRGPLVELTQRQRKRQWHSDSEVLKALVGQRCSVDALEGYIAALGDAAENAWGPVGYSARSALHVACLQGNFDTISALFCMAPVSAFLRADCRGDGPLHCLVRSGHINALRLVTSLPKEAIHFRNAAGLSAKDLLLQLDPAGYAAVGNAFPNFTKSAQ